MGIIVFLIILMYLDRLQNYNGTNCRKVREKHNDVLRITNFRIIKHFDEELCSLNF